MPSNREPGVAHEFHPQPRPSPAPLRKLPCAPGPVSTNPPMTDQTAEYPLHPPNVLLL